MAHLEVIHHRPPSRWDRFKDSLRSITLGPYNTKDPALARLFGGGPVAAGITVSEESALTYAAVWQAVSLIAGDVGSLPLHLYKRSKDGGKTRFDDHPLYYILHDAPNPEMTALVFRETLQAHILTWGNGYAEIERDGAGRVAALWPLLPHQVTAFRENGQLRYRVAGGMGGQDVILPARDMLHIPGLGFDGLSGYGVVRQARESLGLLAAAERFGSTFFGNGSTFGGVLSHPRVLGDKGQQSLRSSIEAAHRGPDKAHRFLVLEEGMAYQKLGVDPNDAQFLETRKFQITEICRWFNLSPSKLRELDNSSVRANIEQDAIDYVVTTLRPWVVRWEQELNRKLVSARERFIQHAEFNLEGLLRGDTASRYAAYAVGRQWGWLSVDDVRVKENMNPLPGGQGQIYLVPVNMAPADRLNDIIDKQVAPPPPPVVQALQDGPADEPEADEDEQERAEWRALLAEQATTIGDLQARHELLAEARDAAAADVARLEQAHGERAAAVLEAEQRLAAVEASAADLAPAHAAIVAGLTSALDAERESSTAAHQRAADLAAAEVEAVSRAMAIEQARLDAVAELESARSEREQAQRDVDAAQAEVRARDAAVAQARAEASAALTAQSVAEQARAAAEAEAAVHAARTAQLETALAAAVDDVAATNQSAAKRMTALITANRAVLVDAISRLVRREAEKARSKRATPDKLRTWAASFYEAHEADLWCDALRPVVAVHLTLIDSDRSVDEVTRALVETHMGVSRRQIGAVAESDPSDYQRALDTTLQRWETQRPDAVADHFMREEIAYVRSIG
jgi:HK97 family phage portal protein